MDYKNIFDKIKYFADNHLMVGSSGYSYLFDITTSDFSNKKFPIIWIDPFTQSNINKNIFEFNFNIAIFDKLLPDNSNLIDVLNDTSLIAIDLITYYHNLQSDKNFRIDINNIPLEPFSQSFGSICAGWTVTLNFKTNYVFKNCELPIKIIEPETKLYTITTLEQTQLFDYEVGPKTGTTVQSIYYTNNLIDGQLYSDSGLTSAVTFNFKGTYSNSSQYYLNDVVTYTPTTQNVTGLTTRTYYALQPSFSKSPVSYTLDYWHLYESGKTLNIVSILENETDITNNLNRLDIDENFKIKQFYNNNYEVQIILSGTSEIIKLYSLDILSENLQLYTDKKCSISFNGNGTYYINRVNDKDDFIITPRETIAVLNNGKISSLTIELWSKKDHFYIGGYTYADNLYCYNWYRFGEPVYLNTGLTEISTSQIIAIPGLYENKIIGVNSGFVLDNINGLELITGTYKNDYPVIHYMRNIKIGKSDGLFGVD